MRRRMIALLTTTMLSATVAAGAVPAFGSERDARRSFIAQTDRPTEFFGLTAAGMPRPELCDPTSSRCLVTFVGFDRFTGTLDGTQANAGALSVDFATFVGEGVSLATFTGSVTGCPGSGTALLRYTVQLGARPGQNLGTFEVVDGSGTAGLAGLAGRGSFVATPDYATGAVSTEGRAHLRCARRS